MSTNQIEANLEAITITIAYLEKNGTKDPEFINKLKKERKRLLRELKVFSEDI